MSEIDYQALRETAVKATWGDWDSYKPHRGARGYEVRLSSQAIAQHVLKNNAEFIAAFNPKVALALLDEINALEETRINDVCRIAELTKQLESAKSKLNEQREHYEGVIADGGKRIAELEKSEEQLINERDHAESALADMYFAATGDRPEWSNCFSFSDAVDAVVDRIADLEAKQPSPVVPDNTSESLAYAYKELTPEIMRGHIAVFERYGIAPNDSTTTIQALRIALASLEAEPIGFRCRRNDNLGDWSYVYHREPDDFERKHLVIEGIYAAPPAPVVPEEKPMPNPLSMYAVDAVAAIAEVRGWNACRAAMLKGDKS